MKAFLSYLTIVSLVLSGASYISPNTAQAFHPASPEGCNADNTIVNIARSTSVASPGETITFTVSAGNSASGDGCDITDRSLTLTLPDGTTQVFGPFDYPNPTVTAIVGSADYIASVNDLVGNTWTAEVVWDGILMDGFDNPSNGDKAISVNYVPVALQVTKTAVPVSEVGYNWEIDKSVAPATWNLFMGDTGTSEYTINVTKTEDPEATNYSVTGVITIHNPALVAANITTVSDDISGVGAASVVCPQTLPYSLPAGQDLICTYSSDLPDGTLRTNTATVTTTGDVNGDDGTAQIDFANVVPTVTNGTISVDDTNNLGDFGPVSVDTTHKYSRQFVCGDGQGEFADTGNVVGNTATIVGTGISDDASVTVNCYDIHVSKIADSSFTRTYNWNVEKSVDKTTVEADPGQTITLNYTVTANVTGSTDSAWSSTGTIAVHNPAPMAATLNSVADVVTGVGSATVNCGVTFPYALASGATLNCTYGPIVLPDGTTRVNTATVVQQNYDYDKVLAATSDGTTPYSGTANIVFGAPENLIDEAIDVSDSLQGALGTVSVAQSPKEFKYSRTAMYEGDQACGDHTINNTATIVTNDTRTQDSASASAVITVICPEGCTLTQGYWKTHSEKGPAPYDATWALLANGANTTFYKSGTTWYNVFKTAPKGNAYYQLAHQYMAARLNILAGADTTPAVDAAMASALTLFNTYTPAQISLLKGSSLVRKQFISLAGILGSYNEGLIGPGHCDDREPLRISSI